MSTRANVVIKDSCTELWFYRHADGYPEGVLPSLNVFLEWIKNGWIRKNVTQSAGWLILIGADEYKDEKLNPDFPSDKGRYDPDKYKGLCPSEPGNNIPGWKVGAYEPTHGKHGDVEYIYYVDLENQEIKIEEPSMFAEET